jgi:hypothetical protein
MDISPDSKVSEYASSSPPSRTLSGTAGLGVACGPTSEKLWSKLMLYCSDTMDATGLGSEATRRAAPALLPLAAGVGDRATDSSAWSTIEMDPLHTSPCLHPR